MTDLNKMYVYACDFETTTSGLPRQMDIFYDNVPTAEVWSFAAVRCGSNTAYDPANVLVWDNIGDGIKFFSKRKNHSAHNTVLYFHNLKFDGHFILSWLMNNPDYTPMPFERKLKKNEFSYMVDDSGAWYSITIGLQEGKRLEIRDSLKILPTSIKKMAKDFPATDIHGKPIKKLDMDYTDFYVNEDNLPYIQNDVLILKSGIESMYAMDMDKLTIGSCAQENYKKLTFKATLTGFDNGRPVFNGANKAFMEKFPKMSDPVYCNPYEPQYDSADQWLRRGYRGGWCYLAPEYESKELGQGITLDVNSLYPSMMHSESGNYYPIGEPHWFKGTEIPDSVKYALEHRDFSKVMPFLHIKMQFKIKKGYLPFIQIKDSVFFKGNVMQTSSCIDWKGEKREVLVDYWVTGIDYCLMMEHYLFYSKTFEVVTGCWFNTELGLFDNFIDTYKQMKIENSGVGGNKSKRAIAKLMLNNLYGKFGTKPTGLEKVFELDDKGMLDSLKMKDPNEKPRDVYLPVAMCVTSYGREFTIRNSQKLYHKYGDDRGFVYADTDSMHCVGLTAEDVGNIPIHSSKFCNWKIETTWDKGKFVRQKTYYEHGILDENYQEIDEHTLKCAGMPESLKKYFLYTCGYTDYPELTISEQQDEELLEFLKEKHTLEDFKVGLRIPHKLTQKVVRGGVLLVNTTFVLRENGLI